MHKEKNLISILMPVYNGSLYIREALESIINQTYTHFELIAIDDSSTDDSLLILKEYEKKDNRIRVISNKYKKGISGSLNSGIDIHKGDFIARADADDINVPNRLEIQLSFLLKNKKIDIVGGGYTLFGNTIHKKIFHPKNSTLIAWKFLSDTFFCHPTIMFRSNILINNPHYPYTTCEDFAFLSKIIHTHRGYNVPNILIFYRQHSKNYSHVYFSETQKSIYETYVQNFLFYVHTTNNADIFYEFHKKNILKIKNIYQIHKICIIIASSIFKNYNTKIPCTEKIKLFYTIYKQMIYAVVRTYIKK